MAGTREQEILKRQDEQDTLHWVFEIGERYGKRGIGPVKRSAMPTQNQVIELEVSKEEKIWRSKASCRGDTTGKFFPPKGGSDLPAYCICRKCPVRMECLEFSLPEQHGIWAGFSQRERAMLRKAVSEGKDFYELADRLDEKKHKKLVRAVENQSPNLWWRGTRSDVADIEDQLFAVEGDEN